MGLKEWIERKKQDAKIRNESKSEALRSYYQSEEYKKAVLETQIQKMKEGKGSDFGSWLKRVSNNAAHNLGNENINTNNIKKILGEKNYYGNKSKKKGDE